MKPQWLHCVTIYKSSAALLLHTCDFLGAAHPSETNCLKHVAWNVKYLYDATNQYISMEQRTLWNKKCMFLAICFMKLINCVVWGNVAQLRTLLLGFSLIQMEWIQQIAGNMFPKCALSCKYVACNIFMKHVSCNMFSAP